MSGFLGELFGCGRIFCCSASGVIGPICLKRITLFVDQIGFGNAIDAVVDADPTVHVEHRRGVGVAVTLSHAAR